MKKLGLYLETSVWNFVFADDAPEKKEITLDFFNLVRRGVYEIYISEIVINEIQRAPLKKKRDLMGIVEEYGPDNLGTNAQIQQLAAAYMEARIVPVKKIEDALHVAVATVHGIDAVVSWNFDHLANLRKADLFNGVNMMLGYTKRMEIITPAEVSRV